MIDNKQSQAADPVCGMAVDPETAAVAGLSAQHHGRTFYFCGKGADRRASPRRLTGDEDDD